MNAFELADSIRYLDDIKLDQITLKPSLISNIEASLALNSLKISKDITPDLYACLKKTCSNLNLNINKVNAYVTSSPEIQAGCISSSKDKCIITLTSAVINLLDLEEINFIIGHELGHYLLSHSLEEQSFLESQEGFIKQRAQEISVDRVGLMACKDINIAIRAITKSLSGLEEKYIAFNMQGFLDQLNLDVAKNEAKGRFSSHPSFVLRVKALIRFSLSDPYLSYVENGSGTPLIEIDNLIQRDLNTYIDKDLRKDIKGAKEMVLFWGYAFSYVRDGILSKDSQRKLVEKFGSEMNKKLINMLSSYSKAQAIQEVRNKLKNAINHLRKTAPNTAKKELNNLLMQIEKETSQKGLLNEVSGLS